MRQWFPSRLLPEKEESCVSNHPMGLIVLLPQFLHLRGHDFSSPQCGLGSIIK